MSEDEKEDPDNIIIMCRECSDKLYPSKGRWTKNLLRYAKLVKKKFGREHMWVKITELKENHLVGIVANIPILPTSPKYGTEVTILYHEIEDAK